MSSRSVPTWKPDDENLAFERRRVQELLRFYQPTAADTHNIDLSSVKLSSDPALTALTQLGTLRTGCDRAFVSLISQDSQYVLAEATRTVSIRDKSKHGDGDRVYLGARTLDLGWGVCPGTMKVFTCSDRSLDINTANISASSQSYVINDMSIEECYKDRPYVKGFPFIKFYAEVPLETSSGYVIGSFCVVDNKSRSNEDHAEILATITEIASAIMDHMQLVQLKHSATRGRRMANAMSSFFEGSSPTATSPSDSQTSAFPVYSEPGCQSAQNSSFIPQISIDAVPVNRAVPVSMAPVKIQKGPLRPALRTRYSSETVISCLGSGDNDTIPSPDTTIFTSDAGYDNCDIDFEAEDDHIDLGESIASESVKHMLSRASNLIREGIDLEGVIFLDSSSNAHAVRPDRGLEQDKPCSVLSHSFRSDCSHGGQNCSRQLSILSESRLRALQDEHPRGAVFFYDEAGFLTYSHSDTPVDVQLGQATAYRYTEAARLLDMLPGARSVAVWPLGETDKTSGLTLGFAWSSDSTRPIRVEDYTYLRAFANSIVVEMSRLEIMSADKAKSDFLSSISHELRSPLHGILANAELLSTTSTNQAQREMIEAIEVCGRTLLDTMDHLLDFAKINNFNTKTLPPTPGLDESESFGLGSLTTDVDLSSMVQDVVQGVLAGQKFQIPPSRRSSVSSYAETPPSYFDDHLLSLDFNQKDKNPAAEDVMVILDISQRPNWVFTSEAGAWKRILMNLFGNALKYTEKGFVKVSLECDDSTTELSESLVTLTITDSGKGMSPAYLKNQLFQPFAQEDILSVGAGLGLSIVHQIVTALNGSISVESELGSGTTVTVSIPLRNSGIKQNVTSSEEARLISRSRQQASDHTLSLVGLNIYPDITDVPTGILDVSVKRMMDLKNSAESMATSWFNMNAMNFSALESASGDVIMVMDTELGRYLQVRGGSAMAVWDVSNKPVIVLRQSTAAPSYELPAGWAEDRVAVVTLPLGPRNLAKALSACMDYCSRHRALEVSFRRSQTLPSPSRPKIPPKSSALYSLISRKTSMVDVAAQAEKQSTVLQRPVNKSIPKVSITEVVSEPRPIVPEEASSKAVKKAPCVLLVEDNEINLKILVTFMKRLKFRYATAINGLDALQTYKAAAGKFDFVIMDISMPVMDGFESTRRIRAYEIENHLQPRPVIALTGLASAKAQQDAFASGVDTFLTKPAKLAELRKVLGA